MTKSLLASFTVLSIWGLTCVLQPGPNPTPQEIIFLFIGGASAVAWAIEVLEK